MATIKDKDPRFQNLEFKAGVMLMVAIAGIALLVLLLGIERDLFTKKFTLKFIADSGSGINKGMPVKLSGFKVGRVSRVELIDGARVRVTTVISRKYSEYLREGVRVYITKEGYIGDPYVDIAVGDLDAPLLSDGDTMSFHTKNGMEQLINEAKPALAEIKEIIHYINDPEGDIKIILGNLKEISGKLEQTRAAITETTRDAGKTVKRIDRLVERVDVKIDPVIESAARVFAGVESMTGKMESVIDRLDTVSRDIVTITHKLPSTVTRVDSILDDVKLLSSTLGKGAPEIMDVIRNGNETLSESKELITGIKTSWPVRLFLPKKNVPHLVPLDSFSIKQGAVVSEQK